jgi:hypothetical protein
MVCTFILLVSLNYETLIVLSDCIWPHADNRHITHKKDTKVRKNEHIDCVIMPAINFLNLTASMSGN